MQIPPCSGFSLTKKNSQTFGSFHRVFDCFPPMASTEKYARDLFRRGQDFRIVLSLNVAPSGKGWRALGDELGYSVVDLDLIRLRDPTNPIGELLKDWMPKNSATVSKLLQALRTIENDAIADQIEERLISCATIRCWLVFPEDLQQERQEVILALEELNQSWTRSGVRIEIHSNLASLAQQELTRNDIVIGALFSSFLSDSVDCERCW
jgi:hypothetical protein